MYSKLGEKIKIARESKGISQKDLAQMINMSDRTISAYEGGKKLPPIDTLFDIADRLDRSIVFFLTDDDDPASIAERVYRTEQTLLDLLEDVKSIKSSIAPQGIDLTPPNVPVVQQ